MFLRTTGLTKDYGDQKGAFEVDMQIRAGEVVGFIGPNGAGKSTTLAMVAGYSKPTAGSFELFGNQISWGDVPQYNPQLVIMPSEASFSGGLKVSEILQRARTLLNAEERVIEHLVAVFKVDLNKKYESLSLGNRKKISLIATLMADADLYVFDEPTSGLDPLMQQVYLDELRLIRSKHKSILLSSHVLSEVQAVCDRLYMIKEGKMIFEGVTKEILAKALKVVKVFNPPEKLTSEIQKIPTVDRVVEHSDRIDIFTNSRYSVMQVLMKHKVEEFLVENPQLEEMFLESYK